MVKDGLECVALFGGSFDPPHIGHKSVVEEALKSLKINKLIVVPTYLNPFKTESHSTAEERFLMTEEMFEPLSNVLVDDFEINQKKSVKTATTVAHFQEFYCVKYFIIGADNLTSIDKWYKFSWLNSQVTWVVAKRAGYPIDTSKLREFKILEVHVDISSTEIRDKEKKGREISMNMDERVERIVTFLDSKKAEEIEVFNLDEVDYIAERVVIANAISSKHALALAEQLKVELKPHGEEFLHIDESEDWVVSDLGDILIHIMTTDARQTYSIEEFLAELTAGKFKSPYIL